MDELIKRADALAMIDGMKPPAGNMGAEIIKAMCWAGVKSCVPAVDAAPVVHARPVWINPLNPGAKMCTWKCSSLCSVCGDYVAESWKYCPNCGAKMDGETTSSGAVAPPSPEGEG